MLRRPPTLALTLTLLPEPFTIASVAPPLAMSDNAQYTPEEQLAIREQWSAAHAADCPRCHVALTARSIGGGSFGLGYARKREWLLCPQCRRSAIFDVRRGTRN